MALKSPSPQSQEVLEQTDPLFQLQGDTVQLTPVVRPVRIQLTLEHLVLFLQVNRDQSSFSIGPVPLEHSVLGTHQTSIAENVSGRSRPLDLTTRTLERFPGSTHACRGQIYAYVTTHLLSPYARVNPFGGKLSLTVAVANEISDSIAILDLVKYPSRIP
jgi:hypothetical protein